MFNFKQINFSSPDGDRLAMFFGNSSQHPKEYCSAKSKICISSSPVHPSLVTKYCPGGLWLFKISNYNLF